jgi:glycosyl transferase family 25
VIHIKNNNHRKKKIENRFRNQKLHYFDAIDTQNEKWQLYSFYLENEQIQELFEYNISHTRKSHKNLLPGAVGCFLSHISLYKKLLSLNENSFIIIEDDIVPNASFFKTSSFLQRNMPSNVDIILLDYILLHPMKQTIHYKNIQLTPVRQFILTTCYIINKKSILKILDTFKKDGFKIKVQFDFYLSQLIHRGILSVFGVYPTLCHQDKKEYSQIQGGHILKSNDYSL